MSLQSGHFRLRKTVIRKHGRQKQYRTSGAEASRNVVAPHDFRPFLFPVPLQPAAVEREEIEIEQLGDAHQDVRIDGALFEKYIDVRATDRQLPGEPDDTVPTLVEPAADSLADVYLHGFGSLHLRQAGGRGQKPIGRPRRLCPCGSARRKRDEKGFWNSLQTKRAWDLFLPIPPFRLSHCHSTGIGNASQPTLYDCTPHKRPPPAAKR